jgi:hypothetical protein
VAARLKPGEEIRRPISLRMTPALYSRGNAAG